MCTFAHALCWAFRGPFHLEANIFKILIHFQIISLIISTPLFYFFLLSEHAIKKDIGPPDWFSNHLLSVFYLLNRYVIFSTWLTKLYLPPLLLKCLFLLFSPDSHKSVFIQMLLFYSHLFLYCGCCISFIFLRIMRIGYLFVCLKFSSISFNACLFSLFLFLFVCFFSFGLCPSYHRSFLHLVLLLPVCSHLRHQ